MLKREINFADWTGRPQREIITPSLFNDVPNGLQRVIAANQMSWTGNHVLEGCSYDGTSLSEGWVLVNGKIVRVPPQAVGLSIGASLGVNDDGTAVNDESYDALSKAVARVPLWTRIDTGYIDVRPMTSHDGTNLPMFRRAAMHERRIEGKLAFSEAGDPNVDLIEIGIESGEPEIHVQDAGGNDAYIRPDRVGLNDTTFLEYNKLQLADGDEINAASNVMRFLTASTERARVTATGDVGIGITDPLSKLHVQGSMRSHDLRVREAGATDVWSGSLGQISIKKNDGFPFISFHDSGGGRVGLLQMGGTNCRIHVDAGNPFSIWTNSLERMRVLGDGKVGIGTETPSKKLDVSGDGRLLNGDLLLEADSYAAGARIGILNKASGNSVTMYMGARATSTTRSIVVGTESGSSQTGDILRVSADGKVGVGLGADYPDRTLDVNGTGRFTGLLTADGGIAVNTQFYPTVSVDLGALSNRWSTVYGVAGNFSGTVTANAFSGGTISGTTGTFNGNVTVTGNVLPSGASRTIGASASRWSTIYGAAGDFSGALDVTGAATFGNRLLIDSGTHAKIVLKSTSAGNAAVSYTQFYDSANAYQGYVGYGSSANSNLTVMNRTATGVLQLGTVDVVRLSIDTAGNVGIGGNVVSGKSPVPLRTASIYTPLGEPVAHLQNGNADGSGLITSSNPGKAGESVTLLTDDWGGGGEYSCAIGQAIVRYLGTNHYGAGRRYSTILMLIETPAAIKSFRYRARQARTANVHGSPSTTRLDLRMRLYTACGGTTGQPAWLTVSNSDSGGIVLSTSWVDIPQSSLDAIHSFTSEENATGQRGFYYILRMKVGANPHQNIINATITAYVRGYGIEVIEWW